MQNNLTVKRICKNAIMLAMLCIIGMFSVPIGENIKVSLQLLIVLIIGLTATSVFDSLIITSLYLVLGLFLPIYAGFHSSITPTFGYIISFVVISIPLYFIPKIKAINNTLGMVLASIVSLLICYLIGTIFMMFYLNITLLDTLLISVVPYIPFDIMKIYLAIVTVKVLNKTMHNE